MADRYAGSARGEGGGFGGGGMSQLCLPRPTPGVKFLLISNFAIWLALYVGGIAFDGLEGKVLWTLGLRPADWFSAPQWFPFWQLITSGFLHAGPGHLIGNLLQIYFFGTMVEQAIGTRRFAAVYAGALLAGGLLHLVLQGIIEPRAFAVGASGAALGLTITAAVLRPNATVILLFIPIALKWLAIGIVALDFYGAIETLRGRGDQVAHWVHLGGAAYGFAAAKKGWIWIDPIEWWQKRKQSAAVEKRQSEDQRMDELLAKISREGMNSLSRSEKEFLKRVSSRR